MASQTLLVLGGNGFLGSAVARAAIARGWTVHSLSRSGLPPTMPDGTIPDFTTKVNYHSGSVFEPETYAHLLPSSTAVVHSLGILFEGSGYKQALKGGGGALDGLMGLGGNPLERVGGDQRGQTGTYERTNRDSALSVLEALRASKADKNEPTSFVYVSAEDIFRPFVDGRYISTKREAEQAIVATCASRPVVVVEGEEGGGREVVPFIVRPGIMTSPTYRPLLTPLIPLLALSASLPPILPTLLKTFSPSGAYGPAGSFARALETRTLDVDEVGEAVCRGIESRRSGVAGVEVLRKLSKEGSVIKENQV